MDNARQNIIIYKTADGRASVALYAKDGNIWMNQSQLAELFATSKQNIGQHTKKPIAQTAHLVFADTRVNALKTKRAIFCQRTERLSELKM